MSIDPAELRRRNLIPPSAMPYKTPNGPIYDSGEFAADPGKGAGARGLEWLSGTPQGLGAERESCAASASAAFSKSPAAFSTKPSTCGSSRTAR